MLFSSGKRQNENDDYENFFITDLESATDCIATKANAKWERTTVRKKSKMT